MRRALELISTDRRKKWAVFSDWKAALQCIRSVLRRGWHEKLTYDIIVLDHHLAKYGYEIDFQWAPSHGGISGND